MNHIKQLRKRLRDFIVSPRQWIIVVPYWLSSSVLAVVITWPCDRVFARR